MKYSLFFLAACCGLLLMGADQIRLWPTVSNLNPSAGEEVEFKYSLSHTRTKEAIKGKQVRYTVLENGLRKISEGTLDSNAPMSFKFTPEKNGVWYYVKADVYDPDGKLTRNVISIERDAGIVTDPKSIKPVMQEPADFDAFWKDARAELAAVPLKYTVTELKPVLGPQKQKLRVFDVKINCVGGVPCSGILTIPDKAKDKSLPVVVRFPGAGVCGGWVSADLPTVITFCINAHGIDNMKPKNYYQTLQRTTLSGYERQGCSDARTSYFRNMILRCIRAVEFVKTIPEWNQRDLISFGGSQGGFLAIAAAALCADDVTLCVTDFPAVCDLGGSLAVPGRQIPWPRIWSADKNGKFSPKLQKIQTCMNYFDTVHFAKRLKCPFYTAIGYADTVTPPPGVYAMINSVPPACLEDVAIRSNGGHGGCASWTGRGEINALAEDCKKRN